MALSNKERNENGALGIAAWLGEPDVSVGAFLAATFCSVCYFQLLLISA